MSRGCGCPPQGGRFALDSLTREMSLERRLMARKLKDLEDKNCKHEDDYKDSQTVKLRRTDGKLEADLNIKSNSLLTTEGGLAVDKEAFEAYLEAFLENKVKAEVVDAFGDIAKLELEKD